MKVIILVTGLFVIQAINSYGQANFRDGYIITLERDTIYGKLGYRSGTKNYQVCSFKQSQDISDYLPSQINGFGFLKDKFYSSEILEGSFVEVLVSGDLSLFKSQFNFLAGKKGEDIYTLETPVKRTIIVDGVRKIKEDRKWLNMMAYLTGDCLNQDKLKKLRLNEKDLTKLVIQYNECRGSEFIEYKASKPWTKLDPGVIVGVTTSSIRIKNINVRFDYLSDSYTSTDPSIGFTLGISSPRVSERFAFQPEVYLLKSSFSELKTLENVSRTEFHDTYIELTTISVPLSIKYTIPKGAYLIYFLAGVVFDYYENAETQRLSEIITNNIVNSSQGIAFEMKESAFGFGGGIGFQKQFKKFKGGAMIRFEQISDLNEIDPFGDSIETKVRRVTFSIVLQK